MFSRATPVVPVGEDIKSSDALLKPLPLPPQLREKMTALLTTDLKKSSKSKKSKGKGLKIVEGADGTTWNLNSESFPFTRSMPLLNHVHRYRQQVESGTVLTTSTTLSSFGYWAFSLSLLSQASTFSSMFDQYRVELIELWVTPNSQTGDVGMNSKYCTVVDVDDSTLYTNYNDALECESCVTSNLNDAQYRRWVPHVAVAAYSGAFTSYMNVEAPWIDVGSPSVLHYGVKLAAQVSAVSHSISANARITLAFRNVR